MDGVVSMLTKLDSVGTTSYSFCITWVAIRLMRALEPDLVAISLKTVIYLEETFTNFVDESKK